MTRVGEEGRRKKSEEDGRKYAGRLHLAVDDRTLDL